MIVTCPGPAASFGIGVLGTILIIAFTSRFSPNMAISHTGWYGAASHTASNEKTRTYFPLVNRVASKSALRNDWSSMWPISDLAKRIAAHQANCALPADAFKMYNVGMGSDLHTWGQGLCNAMEINRSLSVRGSWVWNDRAKCASPDGSVSPLSCYFGRVNPCADDVKEAVSAKARETIEKAHEDGTIYKGKRFPLLPPASSGCASIHGGPRKDPDGVRLWQAAATEFLFSHVQPIITNEANRQARLLFATNGGSIPRGLITVHVRWGDKRVEMKLIPIEAYIDAVTSIVSKRNLALHSDVHIYLATEDPAAVTAFRSAADPAWKIYADQMVADTAGVRPTGNPIKGCSTCKGNSNLNHALVTAAATKGRAGVLALGSLLVGLEATDFVLTSGSNWSRLIDELRRAVIDPRCGGCTSMVDLSPAKS